MRRVDISGQRYGMLVALEAAGARKGNAMWLFQCDCGNKTTTTANAVRTGKTRSCGCERVRVSTQLRLTHGQSSSRTYRIWRHMLNRCQMPHHPKFHRYGGRGIKVCDAWKKYEQFVLDMGPAPDGMSIDRIDNNGDYTPANCRWATDVEQAANRSVTRWFVIEGRRQHLAAWCRELGLTQHQFLAKYSGVA